MRPDADRLSEIVEGVSPTRAIEIFKACCNRGPGRLWITPSWFEPRESALGDSLSDPVSEFEAGLLREILEKRFGLDRGIRFLQWRDKREDRSLDAFEQWEAECERARRVEGGLRGFFPWDDVAACRGKTIPAETLAGLRTGGDACPKCGKPATELTWFEFVSPEWTWKHLCGRRGWLAVCDACTLQVTFHMTLMN